MYINRACLSVCMSLRVLLCEFQLLFITSAVHTQTQNLNYADNFIAQLLLYSRVISENIYFATAQVWKLLSFNGTTPSRVIWIIRCANNEKRCPFMASYPGLLPRKNARCPGVAVCTRITPPFIEVNKALYSVSRVDVTRPETRRTNFLAETYVTPA